MERIFTRPAYRRNFGRFEYPDLHASLGSNKFAQVLNKYNPQACNKAFEDFNEIVEKYPQSYSRARDYTNRHFSGFSKRSKFPTSGVPVGQIGVLMNTECILNFLTSVHHGQLVMDILVNEYTSARAHVSSKKAKTFRAVSDDVVTFIEKYRDQFPSWLAYIRAADLLVITDDEISKWEVFVNDFMKIPEIVNVSLYSKDPSSIPLVPSEVVTLSLLQSWLDSVQTLFTKGKEFEFSNSFTLVSNNVLDNYEELFDNITSWNDRQSLIQDLVTAYAVEDYMKEVQTTVTLKASDIFKFTESGKTINTTVYKKLAEHAIQLFSFKFSKIASISMTAISKLIKIKNLIEMDIKLAAAGYKNPDYQRLWSVFFTQTQLGSCSWKLSNKEAELEAFETTKQILSDDIAIIEKAFFAAYHQITYDDICGVRFFTCRKDNREVIHTIKCVKHSKDEAKVLLVKFSNENKIRQIASRQLDINVFDGAEPEFSRLKSFHTEEIPAASVGISSVIPDEDNGKTILDGFEFSDLLETNTSVKFVGSFDTLEDIIVSMTSILVANFDEISKECNITHGWSAYYLEAPELVEGYPVVPNSTIFAKDMKDFRIEGILNPENGDHFQKLFLFPGQDVTKASPQALADLYLKRIADLQRPEIREQTTNLIDVSEARLVSPALAYALSYGENELAFNIAKESHKEFVPSVIDLNGKVNLDNTIPGFTELNRFISREYSSIPDYLMTENGHRQLVSENVIKGPFIPHSNRRAFTITNLSDGNVKVKVEADLMYNCTFLRPTLGSKKKNVVLAYPQYESTALTVAANTRNDAIPYTAKDGIFEDYTKNALPSDFNPRASRELLCIQILTRILEAYRTKAFAFNNEHVEFDKEAALGAVAMIVEYFTKTYSPDVPLSVFGWEGALDTRGFIEICLQFYEFTKNDFYDGEDQKSVQWNKVNVTKNVVGSATGYSIKLVPQVGINLREELGDCYVRLTSDPYLRGGSDNHFYGFVNYPQSITTFLKKCLLDFEVPVFKLPRFINTITIPGLDAYLDPLVVAMISEQLTRVGNTYEEA